MWDDDFKKAIQADEAIAQGLQWHREHGDAPAGITYILDGLVLHWEEGERLSDPRAFTQGVFAVHHDSIAWQTFGVFDENDESVALGWRRVWGVDSLMEMIRSRS